MTDNLNKLKKNLSKLKALLDDPQPGLFTWREMFSYQLGEVAHFYREHCYDRRVGDSNKMTPSELYIKTGEGKRTRYIPYSPEIDDQELTEGQVLTIVGALGATLLMQYEQLIPEHKRNARKIKAVEQAILQLFQGSGHALDPAMTDYVVACWNKAAMTMAKGAIRS